MKIILNKEIAKEMPNSQALGAFNSVLINTGGDIKQYGAYGYAVFDENGKQTTKALFDRLKTGKKFEYERGKKRAYNDLKFREEQLGQKGLKIGIAKEY